MPSISSGFWVASTKNGGSSGKRWRATVTWCSCIASSRLDWVFGVARLISSARTRLAKIGPGWNRKTRWPSSSMRMFVPVMSAGIRSGVNWIRLNDAVDDVGDGPHEHRLAEAGHALEQDVAVGEEAGERLADELAPGRR